MESVIRQKTGNKGTQKGGAAVITAAPALEKLIHKIVRLILRPMLAQVLIAILRQI